MTSVSVANSLWVLRLIRLFACKNVAVKTITALDELGALWLRQIGRPNGLLLTYIQAKWLCEPWREWRQRHKINRLPSNLIYDRVVAAAILKIVSQSQR